MFLTITRHPSRGRILVHAMLGRSMRKGFIASSVLLWTALAACTAGDGKPAQGDWSSLVPSDAICVIAVRSVDELERNLARIGAAMNPKEPSKPEITEMLEAVGLPDLAVDRKATFVAVVSMNDSGTSFPLTWILALQDASARKRLLAQPPDGFRTASSGDFVALRAGNKAPAGGAPQRLLAQLDPGLISVSLDAERLLEKHRATAWMALASAEQSFQQMMTTFEEPGAVDPSSALAMYFDGARIALESAEHFSLRLDWADDVLQADARMSVRSDSPLDGIGSAESVDYAALLGRLDPEATMRAAYALGDWQTRMAEYTQHMLREPAEGAAPSREDLAAAAYFRGITEYQLQPGVGSFLQIEFAPRGLRLGSGFVTTRGGEAVERLDAIMSDAAVSSVLWEVEPGAQGDFVGRPARAWHLRLLPEGWATVFGPMQETMLEILFEDAPQTMRAVQSEDHFLFLLGGDEHEQEGTARRMIEGGQPNAYDRRLAEMVAGAHPAFVASVDFREFMVLMAKAMDASFAEMGLDGAAFHLQPSAADGDPIPFGMYFGIAGSDWRAGLSIDLIGIYRMMSGS